MEVVLVVVVAALVIVIPVIAVGLVRALFRVNEVTDLLKQIRDNTAKPKPRAEDPPKKSFRPPTGTCESCKKTFEITELTKLEIGKTVCPACKKFIKS